MRRGEEEEEGSLDRKRREEEADEAEAGGEAVWTRGGSNDAGANPRHGVRGARRKRSLIVLYESVG